jgi:ribosomal protein L22
MAERKKTTKPRGKRETEAKREAESKEGAKPRGGSKEAAKTEAKAETASTQPAATKTAAGSKPATKPKAAAKPKSAAKQTTSKPAATKTAAESKGADAKSAESKGPGAKSKPAAKKAAAKQAPERPVIHARARYVRVAPRKARLIADQVRGLPLEDARTLLRFSARGPARDIAKLIDSAASNAENNHDLVADDLLVSDIHVDEGPTLRRYRPRALGRATRINKRTSHIAVALTPED